MRFCKAVIILNKILEDTEEATPDEPTAIEMQSILSVEPEATESKDKEPKGKFIIIWSFLFINNFYYIITLLF